MTTTSKDRRVGARGVPGKRFRAALLMVLLLGLVLPPARADAWKPYTHNHTGNEATRDIATGKGTVRINGRDYRVRPSVASAIQAWPQFYNGGVIGPDGFPDLVYGQSVIHPNKTGAWLRHIHTQAWKA